MSKLTLGIKKEEATIELNKDYDGICIDVTTVDGDTITVAHITDDGILRINNLDEDQVETLKPYFEFDGDYIQTEND